MRVSVIVVSFNTRDLLRRCLASLPASSEVIVIDNASSDGSAEMVAQEFPTAKLIANAENRGFGAANNQGLDAMTGDLALFLNSDAWATPGAIEELARAMESGVVACGGKLVNSSEGSALGDVQLSCCSALTLWAVFCEQTGLEKLFPSSPLWSPYWLTRRLLQQDPVGPHEVAQVMGACLMARPVERFDERYFLYVEDTDLCLRLSRHGTILYVPQAVFGHALGASGARWLSVALYNFGKELYFRIHSGFHSAFVCFLFNRLGAAGRFSLWSLLTVLTLGTKADWRRKAGLFWRVLFAPIHPDAR